MVVSTREVALAQQQLEAAIADLSDADLRVESRCPGWTRGHVLTHLARNAEGLANLARWALDGEVVAMYEPGRRDADIEEGASRSAGEIRFDVAAGNVLAISALGLLEGAVATDPLLAERVVRLGEDPEQGPEVFARRLPLMRLQEVVLHHHDLDVGLRPDQWQPALVDVGLPYAWRRVADGLEDPPTLLRVDGWEGDDDAVTVEPRGSDVKVYGSGAELLAWITGRADDADVDRLRVVPAGASLPDLPDY